MAWLTAPAANFLLLLWFADHRREAKKVETISAGGHHWFQRNDLRFGGLVRFPGDWFRHRGIGPGCAPLRGCRPQGRADRGGRPRRRPTYRRAGAMAAAARQ